MARRPAITGHTQEAALHQSPLLFECSKSMRGSECAKVEIDPGERSPEVKKPRADLSCETHDELTFYSFFFFLRFRRNETLPKIPPSKVQA